MRIKRLSATRKITITPERFVNMSTIETLEQRLDGLLDDPKIFPMRDMTLNEIWGIFTVKCMSAASYLSSMFSGQCFEEVVGKVKVKEFGREQVQWFDANLIYGDEELNVKPWITYLTGNGDKVQKVQDALAQKGVNPSAGALVNDLIDTCGKWSVVVDYFTQNEEMNAPAQKLARLLRTPEACAILEGVKFSDLDAALGRFRAVISGGIVGTVQEYKPTNTDISTLALALLEVKPLNGVLWLTKYNLMDWMSQYSFPVQDVTSIDTGCITYGFDNLKLEFSHGVPKEDPNVVQEFLDRVGQSVNVKIRYVDVPDRAKMLADFMVCRYNFTYDGASKRVVIKDIADLTSWKGAKFYGTVGEKLQLVLASVKNSAEDLIRQNYKTGDTKVMYNLAAAACAQTQAKVEASPGSDLATAFAMALSYLECENGKVKLALDRLDTDLVAPPTTAPNRTIQEIVDIRVKGVALRNGNAREELTKNLGVPRCMYDLPHHYEVGYKFDRLFAKLKADHKALPVDFYGTASNGWLESIRAHFGTLDAMKHKFYDVDPKYVGKAVGNSTLRVEHGDIFHPTVTDGVGRGLVCDVAKTNALSLKDTNELVKTICKMNYDWVIIKLFLTPGMLKDDADNWKRNLWSGYDRMDFVKSGKMQNLEFFVVCVKGVVSNPLLKERMNELDGRFVRFITLVHTVMERCDAWMNLATQTGVCRAPHKLDQWNSIIKNEKPSVLFDMKLGRPMAQGYASLQELKKGSSKIAASEESSVTASYDF